MHVDGVPLIRPVQAFCINPSLACYWFCTFSCPGMCPRIQAVMTKVARTRTLLIYHIRVFIYIYIHIISKPASAICFGLSQKRRMPIHAAEDVGGHQLQQPAEKPREPNFQQISPSSRYSRYSRYSQQHLRRSRSRSQGNMLLVFLHIWRLTRQQFHWSSSTTEAKGLQIRSKTKPNLAWTVKCSQLYSCSCWHKLASMPLQAQWSSSSWAPRPI